MINLAHLIEWFNFQVPGGRWQLFEISDLWITPPVLKHCCQNALTAQWTKKLPLIQQQTPAELAADAILDALNALDDIDTADWTVIDFCSGAGGPVPVIETLVNHGRISSASPNGGNDDEREGGTKKPIPFRLSDLHPNLDAWMEHAALSDHLSFIPQPVDATNPPFSVISSTTPGDKSAAFSAGLDSDGRKIFRLFCLSFHHFDDAMAKKVLRSTMLTSDAFAIVELQERRVGSLVLMVLEFWLLLLVTVFWFWHDDVQLLCTYAVPLLPAIHCWDGLVSCLRTRTFGETVALVEEVMGNGRGRKGGGGVALGGNAVTVRRGEWVLSTMRTLHTWPIGYMTVTTGRKMGSHRSSGR